MTEQDRIDIEATITQRLITFYERLIELGQIAPAPQQYGISVEKPKPDLRVVE